jgi:hypothetical protein
MQDMSKALNYLRAAFKLEVSNVPSGIDLIKTLMSAPEEHATEIEETITLLENYPGLRQGDRCQINFVHGCLKYILGEYDVAVKLWISAEKADPGNDWGFTVSSKSKKSHSNPSSIFNSFFLVVQKLSATMRRFHWPSRRFDDTSIRNVLNAAAIGITDESDRQILSTIINCVRKPAYYNQYNRGGGRVQVSNLRSDGPNNWRQNGSSGVSGGGDGAKAGGSSWRRRPYGNLSSSRATSHSGGGRGGYGRNFY